MIATEKDKRSNVSIDLSKPRKAPPLLPNVMQKPLGIGAGVGLTIGVLNWALLGIPLALSAPTGLFLGLAVCILASPGMRHELAEQKRIDQEYKQSLLQRKGRSGAFTQFD
jgi:hypothetical protein